MKKYLTIILLIALGASLFFLMHYKSDEASDITPIKANNEEKLATPENEFLLPEGAVKANSTNDYAYKKEKGANEWLPEPLVYISIDSEVYSIPINIKQDFSIVEWSKDDSYVFVLESAQYYGGQKGHIVDVGEQNIAYTFSTLNNEIVWIDNKSFIYFDPAPNCSDTSCSSTETGITKYNLQSGVKEIISTLPQNQDNNYPLIKNIIIDDDILYFDVSYDYVQKFDGDYQNYSVPID